MITAAPLTDHQGFTEGSCGEQAWYQWRFVDMQDVVRYLLDNVPRKATLHMQGSAAPFRRHRNGAEMAFSSALAVSQQRCFRTVSYAMRTLKCALR